MSNVSKMHVNVISIIIIANYLITVKPVLRGHLWDKKKGSFMTGDLLKEVQFI